MIGAIVKVGPNAGVASATGEAYATQNQLFGPRVTITTNAGVATATTWASRGIGSSLQTVSGIASATAFAADATGVSGDATVTVVQAGIADAIATAYGFTPSLSANAAVAAATGAATDGVHGSPIGLASALARAYDAIITDRPRGPGQAIVVRRSAGAAITLRKHRVHAGVSAR